MADQTPDENLLLQVLGEVESLSAPLQKEAQQILSMTQDSRDIAGALGAFVRTQPRTLSHEDVRRLTTSWQKQNDATRALRAELAEAVPPYSAQYALTTNVSSTSAVTAVLKFGSPISQPSAQYSPTAASRTGRPATSYAFPPEHTKLAEAIQAVFKRQELFPVVRNAMLELGLNRDLEDLRSPLSLLEECTIALNAPSGNGTSPVAVLIALRSCIERTIGELIRRRPAQEPAPSWNEKIESIGKHCGKVGLPSGYFVDLGVQAQRNADNLAKAKERAIPRELLMLQYHDGLKFLEALLLGVDRQRLR